MDSGRTALALGLPPPCSLPCLCARRRTRNPLIDSLGAFFRILHSYLPYESSRILSAALHFVLLTTPITATAAISYSCAMCHVPYSAATVTLMPFAATNCHCQYGHGCTDIAKLDKYSAVPTNPQPTRVTTRDNPPTWRSATLMLRETRGSEKNILNLLRASNAPTCHSFCIPGVGHDSPGPVSHLLHPTPTHDDALLVLTSTKIELLSPTSPCHVPRCLASHVASASLRHAASSRRHADSLKHPQP